MKSRSNRCLTVLFTLAIIAAGASVPALAGGKPKTDCRTHDRCKEHDKCRQHDKAHKKCQPKVDPCKNHDRCRNHDKCRQHDKAHKKCAAKPQVTYSGRAMLVNLTNIGPSAILIGDTGPVPVTGGELNVIVGPTNIAEDFFLELGQATVSAGSNVVQSTVVITNFGLVFTTTNGLEHTLMFDLLQVVAHAECGSNGPVLSSSVSLQNLQLDGAAVAFVVDATTGLVLTNQVITFDGGSIVLHTQSASITGHIGDITAAAIVIRIDGSVTGSIGLVHADVHCGKRGNGACSDRVTGGGFIFGTPSGERANFGVGGGFQNGQLWGHLNYIDHGTNMHVKATAVTGYTVVDATTRQITYDVTIDGVPGTATVVVSDLGKPGRDDLFMITLSTGYTAGGDLGGDKPGGGNIQLHKPKCK